MALVDGDYLALNYVGEMPMDYQLLARFATVPPNDNQGAEIRISSGDSFLSAGLYANLGGGWNRYEFYFNKHLGEEFSGFRVNIDPNEIKPFYIRITKDGFEYDADYSYNGINWDKIGAHLVTRSSSTPSAGVYTWGGDAPEKSKFDFNSFEIVDLTAR